jgi:hypothetical protein
LCSERERWSEGAGEGLWIAQQLLFSETRERSRGSGRDRERERDWGGARGEGKASESLSTEDIAQSLESGSPELLSLQSLELRSKDSVG